ncbi:hypothetical protein EU527_09605 [Candidatus Thorarchaeota archaeon]|nr:MAG: hypothetical protein EU527_09605 [Candidatus Thorarchaeota archaeon]
MIEVVSYKSMAMFYAVLIIGTSLSALLGYFIMPVFMPSIDWDWISILTVYVGFPILLASLAYYFGWRYKRHVVVYNRPDWIFNPVSLSIDEAKNLPSEYNKRNYRLVADSKFWMFFMPVVLLVFIAAVPVYSFLEDSIIIGYTQLIFGFSLSLLFSITLYGAFKSTSNSASNDFTLPLIREALKLAEIQEKIEGVSKVNIILDKAIHNDLTIYDQPRVLLRIKGIEKDSYIESWSDDLGAITKVLCRLYEMDDKPQVVWWWISTDRNFRKYIHPDEIGYYVKSPFESKIKRLGVKDIKLVTETAVALLIREFVKTRKGNDSLRDILTKIDAANIS